ncbi:hypothetical protein TNCV_4435741 [Trichonephila clavipes]|nr:hypothetical protein TNCV_4435741 [Trichonephila clavipes]
MFSDESRFLGCSLIHVKLLYGENEVPVTTKATSLPTPTNPARWYHIARLRGIILRSRTDLQVQIGTMTSQIYRDVILVS